MRRILLVFQNPYRDNKNVGACINITANIQYISYGMYQYYDKHTIYIFYGMYQYDDKQLNKYVETSRRWKRICCHDFIYINYYEIKKYIRSLYVFCNRLFIILIENFLTSFCLKIWYHFVWYQENDKIFDFLRSFSFF